MPGWPCSCLCPLSSWGYKDDLTRWPETGLLCFGLAFLSGNSEAVYKSEGLALEYVCFLDDCLRHTNHSSFTGGGVSPWQQFLNHPPHPSYLLGISLFPALYGSAPDCALSWCVLLFKVFILRKMQSEKTKQNPQSQSPNTIVLP